MKSIFFFFLLMSISICQAQVQTKPAANKNLDQDIYIHDENKPAATSNTIYSGKLTDVRQKAAGFNIVSTTDKGAGSWYLDSSDHTTTDNTGTVFVTANGSRYKRIFSGSVNLTWFGAVGDYQEKASGTDNLPFFNAAIAYCKANHKVLYIPAGKYLTSEKILFDDISVSGDDGFNSFIYVKAPITACEFRGSRNTIENLSVIFDYGSNIDTNAIAFKFATNTEGTPADQFSNNYVNHLYARYAYRSFTCNQSGSTGTLWNNTFVNCRSDFAIERAWNFNAVIGSTSQTWIDCMVDGVNQPAKNYPSAGWYTSNVDDVSWTNCQADDMANGKAIWVNSASNATVSNFRSEASYLTSDNSQLIYCNAANSNINNVKMQAATIDVGAKNTASIVRFGANGSDVVGNISYESITITSGNLYKLNTNGTQFGRGKVDIVGSNIQRSDVFTDEAGERTVFSNKAIKFIPSTSDPSTGTFEEGEILISKSQSAKTPIYAKICITSGTMGTIASVRATVSAGTRLVNTSSTSSLMEGQYIVIDGISGVKRILHIKSSTIFYIDSDADATIKDGAMTYSPAVFESLNKPIGSYDGTKISFDKVSPNIGIDAASRFYGEGLFNSKSIDNAYVNVASGGIKLMTNKANEDPVAEIVNQNPSSSGNLLSLTNGNGTVSSFNAAGILKVPSVKVAIDFGNIPANSELESLTNIKFVGASVGDRVDFQPSINVPGVSYKAFVTSSGVITIYAINFTTSAIDLASQSFKFWITK